MMMAPSKYSQKATLAFLLFVSIPSVSLDRAVAQEQRSSPTSRDEGGGGEGDEFGTERAPVAHVGAGTTDGSTTGYSGPEGNAQAEAEEISLPPLPSADICEPYRDTPAYQSCLWVALRDSPDETGEPADE